MFLLIIIFLSRSEIENNPSKNDENNKGNINSLRAQLIESNNLRKKEELKKAKIMKILYILLLTSLEMNAMIIQNFLKKHKIRHFHFSLLVILELSNLIFYSSKTFHFYIQN